MQVSRDIARPHRALIEGIVVVTDLEELLGVFIADEFVDRLGLRGRRRKSPDGLARKRASRCPSQPYTTG